MTKKEKQLAKEAKAKEKAVAKQLAKEAKIQAKLANKSNASKEDEAIHHISELNKKDQEKLSELLRKEPTALSEAEQEHLQARKIYLTTEEKKKFGVK